MSAQSLLRQAFRQARNRRSHSGKSPSCLPWSCLHGAEVFSRKYCQNILQIMLRLAKAISAAPGCLTKESERPAAKQEEDQFFPVHT